MNKRVVDPFWRECFTATLSGLVAATPHIDDDVVARIVITATAVADAALDAIKGAPQDDVPRGPAALPPRFPTTEIGRVPIHKKF